MKLGRALLTAILVLLLASLLTAAMSFNVLAETTLPVLNIDTGLGYATIQEAIDADATLSGHTIRVNSGTYYENVVVNKSVSLIGDNVLSTIIDGRALGSVIRITADNVSVTGLTVRNSMFGYSGIQVYQSSDNNISGNIVKDNYNGIYLYGSNDSIVEDNDVLGNEYGVHLYGSANISVSDNVASGNMNGIHLDVSRNNVLADNNVSSSGWNGIYSYGSSNNTLSGNLVVSNQGRGIGLQYSFNNTLQSNDFSRNGYGIYFYGSGGNTLDDSTASFNNEYGILLFDSADNAFNGDDVSNNTFGIWFINSGGNGISGNNISANDQFGVRLWNSSNNRFFDNNFIDNLIRNVEQPSNDSFGNFWDDGAQGNFWGDYGGADTHTSGIGDKPYIVDDRGWLGVYSQDSYPLMGQYLQFSIDIENQSCIVAVISNSTISGLQYNRSPDNKTGTLSFNVNATGNKGFSRILIPSVLIAPPFAVTVDHASVSYSVISTNGTHTWVYFTSLHGEHEVTVASVVSPGMSVWSQWWFWGIAGMVLVEAVLGVFTIKYRRKIVEQRRLLQAFNPLVVAQALFETDVERRDLKIREFEKKYGIKIQPRDTLQDVIGSFEKKEKDEKS
ncbi:MAG: NosD domain-containing protein [Candidatus Bathyarchaeia archaeon]|jgi:parallel beta-helix repeat protein